MDERIEALPNAFYDFIVFVGSSAVFAAGLYIGFGGLSTASLGQLGTLDVIVVIVVLVLFSYEYGRIAEAWSSVIVQKPLGFICKYTPFLRNPDFLGKVPDEEQILHLLTFPETRKRNKWTIYFYASLVSPRLGSDLLKRYAWEKLSRNSAFSFCILLMISVLCGFLIYFRVISPFPGHWAFGTPKLGVVLTILTILTYYEYYLRNCWNVDLLIKVLPVLARAEELLRENNKNSTFLVRIRNSADVMNILRNIENKQ